MTSPEFDLISRYFTRPTPEAVLGVGDDCALLPMREGHELAISTDTLVEGVHFLVGADPMRLGHKALAVNLSDLAAMGATPRWFTLALTLPAIRESWLAAFSQGLFALADSANIRLVGGDTTRGPLSMTLTVIGDVPSGTALRRDRAESGDEVWVSGTLGDAALALAHLRGGLNLDAADRERVMDRLETPDARVALGLALRGIAHSAIDVSDGLLADLGHLCARSGLGANIRIDLLPLSPALSRIADSALRQRCALAGGDDYELCFSAARGQQANIRKLAAALDLPLTCIGEMISGTGVVVLDQAGNVVPVAHGGFDHFGGGEVG